MNQVHNTPVLVIRISLALHWSLAHNQSHTLTKRIIIHTGKQSCRNKSSHTHIWRCTFSKSNWKKCWGRGGCRCFDALLNNSVGVNALCFYTRWQTKDHIKPNTVKETSLYGCPIKQSLTLIFDSLKRFCRATRLLLVNMTLLIRYVIVNDSLVHVIPSEKHNFNSIAKSMFFFKWFFFYPK